MKISQKIKILFITKYSNTFRKSLSLVFNFENILERFVVLKHERCKILLKEIDFSSIDVQKIINGYMVSDDIVHQKSMLAFLTTTKFNKKYPNFYIQIQKLYGLYLLRKELFDLKKNFEILRKVFLYIDSYYSDEDFLYAVKFIQSNTIINTITNLKVQLNEIISDEYEFNDRISLIAYDAKKQLKNLNESSEHNEKIDPKILIMLANKYDDESFKDYQHSYEQTLVYFIRSLRSLEGSLDKNLKNKIFNIEFRNEYDNDYLYELKSNIENLKKIRFKENIKNSDFNKIISLLNLYYDFLFFYIKVNFLLNVFFISKKKNILFLDKKNEFLSNVNKKDFIESLAMLKSNEFYIKNIYFTKEIDSIMKNDDVILENTNSDRIQQRRIIELIKKKYVNESKIIKSEYFNLLYRSGNLLRKEYNAKMHLRGEKILEIFKDKKNYFTISKLKKQQFEAIFKQNLNDDHEVRNFYSLNILTILIKDFLKEFEKKIYLLNDIEKKNKFLETYDTIKLIHNVFILHCKILKEYDAVAEIFKFLLYTASETDKNEELVRLINYLKSGESIKKLKEYNEKLLEIEREF